MSHACTQAGAHAERLDLAIAVVDADIAVTHSPAPATKAPRKEAVAATQANIAETNTATFRARCAAPSAAAAAHTAAHSTAHEEEEMEASQGWRLQGRAATRTRMQLRESFGHLSVCRG